MIYGYVRDFAPLIRLTLPGVKERLSVEFTVDTGFAGDLALPWAIAQQIDLQLAERRFIRLADGTTRECEFGAIALEWNEELRETEVLILEGRPLLGMLLLNGCHLSIDISDGGEVVIESE